MGEKKRIVVEVEIDDAIKSMGHISFGDDRDNITWHFPGNIEDKDWWKNPAGEPPREIEFRKEQGLPVFRDHTLEKIMEIDELARLRSAGFSAADILDMKKAGLLGGIGHSHDHSSGCKCAKV